MVAALGVYLRIALLVWALVAPLASVAQNKKKLKGYGVHLGDQPSRGAVPEPLFYFENINKVPYFYDSDELRKIQQFTKKKNNRKLTSHLEDYVLKFGIQNFYKNTNLLWQLGKLYEETGQLEKAKAMYRLILKHYRGRTPAAKAALDSLEAGQRPEYVSLKYYYELVDYRKSIDTLRPPQSILTPLGANVNSEYEDYGPAVNLKSDTMLFTSRRTKIKTKVTEVSKLNEDLYVSHGDQDFWEEATPLSDLNTDYNEGSPTLSPDGKRLFFSRCLSPEGYGNCDIFVTERQPDGKWSKPKNLGPGVNGKAWDSQPSLSHTGDTLYFASDRLGGFGGSDVYMSVRDRKTGIWMQAQNLGPYVNTKNNEVSPCYHPRYKVLYFSSDGQLLNFGKFDIFKTYWKKGQWTEPLNIGPLVNGPGSEYYFTIDYNSKNLYYARSDSGVGGNLDLYSFPLPMEGQPLAVTVLSGSLTDSAGVPLEGIVSVIDLDHGIEVAPQQLRKDGSYDFSLIKNNNYLLIIQGDDFFRIEEQFRLQNDTTIERQAQRISAQKISFVSLDFEKDSYEIISSMEADLNNVFNYLVDHPTYRIKISGHTDLTGDSLANLTLSRNRANAIKTYLSKTGAINPDRIDAYGFGSQQPIIPQEKSEEDRRTNRRVEFEILYPEKKPEQGK